MNFATSQPSVKSKATWTPQRVYYIYMPNAIVRYLAHDASGYIIYLHDVGLSALLVSTDRGNAKAYRPWNEQKTGSTFFCIYPYSFNYLVYHLEPMVKGEINMNTNVESAKRALVEEIEKNHHTYANPFGNAASYRKILDYLYVCIMNNEYAADANEWLYQLYKKQSNEEKAVFHAQVELVSSVLTRLKNADKLK